MSFLRYIVQGMGWQIGADIARDAKKALDETPEEAARREAARAAAERDAAAARAAAAAAAAATAAAAHARDEKRVAAQVDADLKALKKKLAQGEGR